MGTKKRIGIFSGTFDPIHIGHIEACLVAKGTLGLDRVLVMIEKKPRRKQDITDYEHRKKLVNLSIEDFDDIELMEFSGDNITFSGADKLLQNKFENCTFTLIIGSDTLEHIEHWEGLEELADNYSIVVILRDKQDKKEVEKITNHLVSQFKNLKIEVLPPVWAPVSSSDVRARLAKSNDSGGALHRRAMEYVKKHQLYKK